jgi:multidrug efflux pump subunit AcrA (membrane-fusion protein)
MVRVGDRLQKVDVKLGVEGQDRVEILEGLEEGQIIEGL